MGRKRENPEKNHLTHPQAELCLSHKWPVSITFSLHLIGSVVYLTVILMLLRGASSALIAYLRSFYYTPVAFARTWSQGYNKQLFHGGLVNSQNYCPEVTRMTMMDYCPRPKAEGNSPPWSAEAPRV